MAEPPDAARDHYRRQQALARSTVRAAVAIWASIRLEDLDGSWQSTRAADQLLVVVATAQRIAAGQADDYLDVVLAEQSIDTASTASVNAARFAGIASDGRSLDLLLAEPLITTKVAVARSHPDPLAAGRAALTRIVATQVADAGRTAVGTAIVARPEVTRWVRMLNPPSCSRCAILAGRTYAWNAGFDRHPLCDCTAIPSAENLAGDLTTDPGAYFRSLSKADQDKYFTAAGAQAIRDGADIGQIVNARRGMYRADGQTFTTVGTTKRGSSGRRAPGVQRPMPETIYSETTDRSEALEQLRRFGYLV